MQDESTIPKNSSHFPYQACLIPNFPEDVQHQVRNFGNHVVRPLGMVLAVISFACNASVFILAVRTRSLQHPSLLMLSSLAITDVIFSQYSLYRYIEILTHEHVCPKSGPHDSALNVLCSLATLGNLAIISRDRYLAVRKPWWYRKHVTKARALRTICVAWFISVIIAFMVYLSKKFGGRYLPLAQFLCLSFYAICALSIAIHYLSIYFRKTTPVLGRQARAILDWEKRLASTVGWILVVLMFTFLPALLFPMVLYAKGVKNLMPFRPFYVFFFQLNGALNPLLNFGRLKQMRIAVRNLFKCFRRVRVQLSLRNSNDNDNCSNSVNNTNGSNNINDNDNNRDNNYCGNNKNNNNVNNNISNNNNKDNRINTTSETTMTTSTTTSLTTTLTTATTTTMPMTKSETTITTTTTTSETTTPTTATITTETARTITRTTSAITSTTTLMTTSEKTAMTTATASKITTTDSSKSDGKAIDNKNNNDRNNYSINDNSNNNNCNDDVDRSATTGEASWPCG